MNKSTVLVCIFSIGLVGILYSLPKVVVSSEAKDKELAEQSSKQTEAENAGPAGHGGAALMPDQQQEITRLRAGLSSPDKPQLFSAYLSLSDAFLKFQKFDSAAVYAGMAADMDPTDLNLLRAGDRYYEAYGFALNRGKAQGLGEKTREYYQKALDQNPNLMLAKANMAMTYVDSENPMQGIMMLREILDLDPTNEVALFNMGILSMRSNQYSKAVERFSQIVTHNPANTKAKFYLGVCLVETGKREEARKILQEVKQKEQDPAIQEAIAELEERLAAE